MPFRQILSKSENLGGILGGLGISVHWCGPPMTRRAGAAAGDVGGVPARPGVRQAGAGSAAGPHRRRFLHRWSVPAASMFVGSHSFSEHSTVVSVDILWRDYFCIQNTANVFNSSEHSYLGYSYILSITGLIKVLVLSWLSMQIVQGSERSLAVGSSLRK